MGRVPRAAIAATMGLLAVGAALWASIIVGQDLEPDGVICTVEGEYERCTPAEVVGEGLPDPGRGDIVFGASDGTIAAIPFAAGLTQAFYDLFAGGDIPRPGQLWEVGTVDAAAGTIEIASTDVAEAVRAGLPDFDRATDAGKYLGVVDDAQDPLAWRQPPGGGADLATTAPANPAATPAVGTGTTAARGDHVHRFQPLSSFGPVGSSGTCAKANSARDGLSYGDCGSPRVLSNADPEPTGTADPGNSTQVSRADHVHQSTGGGGTATPLSDTTPAALGTAAAGTADAASRGDHVHLLPPAIATNTAAVGAIQPWAKDATTAIPAAKLTAVRGVADPSGQASGSFYSTDGSAAGWLASFSGTPSALGTANAGASRHLARGDHVHPTTGIRQLPDPSHLSDDDILKVESGAWVAATPGGGGGGGGAGASWVELLTASNLTAPADGDVEVSVPTATVAAILTQQKSDEPYIWWRVLFDYPDLQPGRAICLGMLPGKAEIGNSPGLAAVAPFAGPTTAGLCRLTLQVGGVAPCSRQAFRCQLSIEGLPATLTPLAVTLQATTSAFGGGGGGGSATPLSDGAPLALGAAASAGTGTAASRGDHVHPTTGVATSSDLTQVDESLTGLQSVTADLRVSGAGQTTWATATAAGADIAINTSAGTRPTSGWAKTLARPNAGWPTTYYIWARVPEGTDVTRYRVTEVVTAVVDFVEPGGSWRTKQTAGGVDYWLVNIGSPQTTTIGLQFATTVHRTTYAGIVEGVPTDAELDILEDTVQRIDNPSNSNGVPDSRPGHVWTTTECKGSGTSYACDTLWRPQFAATTRERVAHGTGAVNGNSATIAQADDFTHAKLAAGESYGEFVLLVWHELTNQTLVAKCDLPGVFASFGASTTKTIYLGGVQYRQGGPNECGLSIPTSGNATLTWARPASGNLVAGDKWELFGLRWN